MNDYKENLKNGILVDLYYYAIQFARDNDFTKEQASAFFSILKQTHDVAIGLCLVNACFKVGLDQRRNFTQAVEYCNARGGHVIEINNEMENTQAFNIAQGKSYYLIHI